jgi:hypothetical protein
MIIQSSLYANSMIIQATAYSVYQLHNHPAPSIVTISYMIIQPLDKSLYQQCDHLAHKPSHCTMYIIIQPIA